MLAVHPQLMTPSVSLSLYLALWLSLSGSPSVFVLWLSGWYNLYLPTWHGGIYLRWTPFLLFPIVVPTTQSPSLLLRTWQMKVKVVKWKKRKLSPLPIHRLCSCMYDGVSESESGKIVLQKSESRSHYPIAHFDPVYMTACQKVKVWKWCWKSENRPHYPVPVFAPVCRFYL